MARVLETERLYLKELTPDDAPEMFRIYSDPETMRFVTPPPSLAAERENIERHIDKYYRAFGYGLWGTVLKDGDRLIGRCGLLNQIVEGNAEVELSYLIDRPFWNRGLTTEAATAIRDHAFHTLPLTRLISLIHPQNIASRRVAEKAGLSLSKIIQLKRLGDVHVYSIDRLTALQNR
jgi:[ribosomal protein S5]-alanine N-acetyltransferase